MEQLMLDLIPTGAKAVCHVSQNDIGRTIRFNLTSGGTAYTLAGTETIKVFIKKPDGTTAERNIANTSSTYVDWVTGEGDCDVAGKNECELVITSGTTVIGSKNFTMKVEEDPYNGQGVVIETASGNPAVFDTNIVDLFVEIKCTVNAIQEGTPWIDSNVIEKEPYNFRKVAGTASRIGNHLFDKLVGGTVAWNQLIKNGDFSNNLTDWVAGSNVNANVSNNICYLTARSSPTGNQFLMTTNYLAIPKNHKILISAFLRSDTDTECRFQIIQQNPWASLNLETISGINSTRKLYSIIISISDGIASNFNFNVDNKQSLEISNVNLVDLTQAFGTAIADYIYSLEQATAGAGVAFFRKLFPDSYYAYDAGSLKSVKATAHKMVGKNQGNFVDGYTINFSGLPEAMSGRCATVNPITILPDKQYKIYFSGAGLSSVYSVFNGETLVRRQASVANGSTLDTSGGDKLYVCVYDGITVSSCQPRVLFSDITDTSYEPYTAHTYALDDVELRGLFKLDSNNKLYADGDTYESSGDVGRRYTQPIDLSSLNWQWQSTWEAWYSYELSAQIKGALNNDTIPNMISGYVATTMNNIINKTVNNCIGCSQQSSNDKLIAIRNGSDSVTPTGYVIFEKATPTTETADPFTNPQQVDANGTEEYIDSRSPAIPVGHETYYADIYDITGFTSCKISVADGQGVERKSATIAFGQTVYGGYLEYKNGVWVFTGNQKPINFGDYTWEYNSQYNMWVSSRGLLDGVSGTALQCETVAYNRIQLGDNLPGTSINQRHNIWVRNGSSTITPSGLALYELVTPFTLTLTGNQLETLLGENRVSHDCNGNTEVKYLYNA